MKSTWSWFIVNLQDNTLCDAVSCKSEKNPEQATADWNEPETGSCIKRNKEKSPTLWATDEIDGHLIVSNNMKLIFI